MSYDPERTMRYHLSNRQLKELQRGATLKIALPAPDESFDDTDPIVWARGVLNCEPGHLLDAEEMLLPVNPRVRTDGLAAEFGTILHADATDSPDGPMLLVECIVCTIAGRHTDGRQFRHQWPGSYTLT